MNVFDIVGPIMIGPSSSHTAGACRLGNIARTILEERPLIAKIFLHGSFAKTYRGHGTDKAIIAGILGMKPDDLRLRNSLQIAIDTQLEYSFEPFSIDGAHPNTLLIKLQGKNKSISMEGSSVGGGNVVVNKVNGMAVSFTGQSPTIIVSHIDKSGTISNVTKAISNYGANIATFELSRTKKGGEAIMCLEIDGDIDVGVNENINKIENVVSSTLIKPVI